MAKTASILNIPFHTVTQEKVGHWSMTLQLAPMVVQHAKFFLCWIEQHHWMGRTRSLNVVTNFNTWPVYR